MAKTTKGVNSSADKMLAGIETVIKNFLKTTPKFSGAIVDRVNENGTVNIFFPPDSNTIFTNISNQTPFTLAAGDSVEVTLKNGSYSNCWISAKHGMTNIAATQVERDTGISTDIEKILRGHTRDIASHTSSINSLQSRVSTLESKVNTLQSNVSTLQSNVSTLQSKVSTLETNYTSLEARVRALEQK